MLEKLSGNGQGSCDMCRIVKGWSREWTSFLYYIKNKNGLYLRNVNSRLFFDSDAELKRATFCYKHALMVDEARKALNDWEKKV